MFKCCIQKILQSVLILFLGFGFITQSMAGNEQVSEIEIHRPAGIDKRGIKSHLSYGFLENGDFICSNFSIKKYDEYQRKSQFKISYSVQYNDKYYLYEDDERRPTTHKCLQVVATPEYAWAVFQRVTPVKGSQGKEKRYESWIERWRAMDVVEGSVNKKIGASKKKYLIYSNDSPNAPLINVVSRDGARAIIDTGKPYLFANDTLRELPPDYRGCYIYNLDFFPYIHCQPNKECEHTNPHLNRVLQHRILKLCEDGQWETIALPMTLKEYHRTWCQTVLGPEQVAEEIRKPEDAVESTGEKASPVNLEEFCSKNPLLAQLLGWKTAEKSLRKVSICGKGERIIFDYELKSGQKTSFAFLSVGKGFASHYPNSKDPEGRQGIKSYDDSGTCLIGSCSASQNKLLDLSNFVLWPKRGGTKDTLRQLIYAIYKDLDVNEKILWFSHLGESNQPTSGIYRLVLGTDEIPTKAVTIHFNDFVPFFVRNLSIRSVAPREGIAVGEFTTTTDRNSDPRKTKSYAYQSNKVCDHTEGLSWYAVSDDGKYLAGTFAGFMPIQAPETPKGKGKEKEKERTDLGEEEKSDEQEVLNGIHTSIGFLRTPKGDVQLHPLVGASSCSLNHMSGDASVACGESTFAISYSYEDHLNKRSKSCEDSKVSSKLPEAPEPEPAEMSLPAEDMDTLTSNGSRKRKYDEELEREERITEESECTASTSHHDVTTTSQPEEEKKYRSCVRACIWELGSKDNSLDSSEAIELPVPENCIFSTAKHCSSNGRTIVGQYLIPGSNDEYCACVWQRDLAGSYRFFSLQKLYTEASNYNYTIALEAIDLDSWVTIAVGQMGVRNISFGRNFNRIVGYPTIWINCIPYILRFKGDQQNSTPEAGVATHVAKGSGPTWIFGNYRGMYKCEESGKLSIFGGKAFIVPSYEEGIIDLKEWLQHNYNKLADELEPYELIEVQAVSRCGKVIVVKSRGRDFTTSLIIKLQGEPSLSLLKVPN